MLDFYAIFYRNFYFETKFFKAEIEFNPKPDE